MNLRRLAWLLALCALPAAAQQVQTYTENQTGPGLRPLGFPVPLPVASLTPVEGFRDYASLHARLQSLALLSPDVAAFEVGQTQNGRPVWAYVVASPEGADREGRAKPAFFINATTHAREWGIPEISTGLVERMAAGADDGGLVRYLLDNTRLVIVPVQNVDGFLQTQRFPTQVVVGQDTRAPNDWPRDGRMRRKNMRGVDEVLTTFADHLRGIDLNRNHPPFWGTTSNGGQLTNPNDLTYRGAAAQSEAEAQALVAAANLAPTSRLRLGIDLHSYSRVFFSSNTGRQRLNAIQSRLLGVLAAHHVAVPTVAGTANGKFYPDVRDPPNVGIGTAAEYFAYSWLVPAWTLEIEPGDLAGREYGGTSESHGGFVLPASQARRVREAWAESHLVAFYFMAGAPHLARLRLFDAASGLLLREQRWEYRPQTLRRELLSERFADLRAGQRVRVELAFSKPMRHRANGVIAPLPGVGAALLPQVWLSRDGQRTALDVGEGQWLEQGWRYRDDSFAFELNLPEEAGEFGFDVGTTDMVGLQLDADPATPVDWDNGAWTGWNAGDGSEGDIGGIDAAMRFQTLVLGSGQLPRIAQPPPSVVAEGDVVRLKLVLDSPAEGVVRVIAEDPAITVVRPVISPPPPTVPIVEWDAGESGARELFLRAPDNAIADGDRSWEAVIGVSAAGGISEFARLTFQLLDNDAPGRAVVSAPYVDFGVACCDQQISIRSLLLQHAQPGRTLEVVLRGDLTYRAGVSQGRLLSTPVVGEVMIHGNGAGVVLPPHTEPAPLFRVEEGSVFSLDRVAFGAEAQIPEPSPPESSSILVDSAGVARISRADVTDVRGQGSLFGGSGEVRLERSSIRGLDTSPLYSNGTFRVESSSLIRNTSLNAVLASAETAEASWNSLISNSSAYSRFGMSIGAGRLLFTGNLIQRNLSQPLIDPPRPDCGPGVESGGFNLYSGTDCVSLTAEGDRRGLDLGYSAPFPPAPSVEPWLAPLGVAVDYGGDCGPVDQRGAPRPQTLDPDAEPLCDVGAIELGVNPYRGIWLPARSGHGVDLQTSGNRLLLAWYTYDDDGQPTAYQAIAPLTGPRWRAELQRSSRDPATGAIRTPVRVGEVGIDFDGDASATLRWRFDARGVDGSERIEAYAFASGEPRVEVTGLWYPPADSGYGATITRRGEVTAVGLYYYDAQGALRWALGAGSGADADRIQMSSYTGFCPDCDAQANPVQSQLAGSLLYHFLTPRRARLDMELVYPGPAGGTWARERAAFVPLNDPVDNREALVD